MIQDNQCNRVLFSALLRERCPKAFRGLTEVLDKYEVSWSLLEGTKDIWCRDYMPIQILPNQFMGYDYHPDYLLHSAEDRATISDGNEICRKLGYACSNMLGSVKMDGGNVVKAAGRAIRGSAAILYLCKCLHKVQMAALPLLYIRPIFHLTLLQVCTLTFRILAPFLYIQPFHESTSCYIIEFLVG